MIEKRFTVYIGGLELRSCSSGPKSDDMPHTEAMLSRYVVGNDGKELSSKYVIGWFTLDKDGVNFRSVGDRIVTDNIQSSKAFSDLLKLGFKLTELLREEEP